MATIPVSIRVGVGKWLGVMESAETRVNRRTESRHHNAHIGSMANSLARLVGRLIPIGFSHRAHRSVMQVSRRNGTDRIGCSLAGSLR